MLHPDVAELGIVEFPRAREGGVIRKAVYTFICIIYFLCKKFKFNIPIKAHCWLINNFKYNLSIHSMWPNGLLTQNLIQ